MALAVHSVFRYPRKPYYSTVSPETAGRRSLSRLAHPARCQAIEALLPDGNWRDDYVIRQLRAQVGLRITRESVMYRTRFDGQ